MKKNQKKIVQGVVVKSSIFSEENINFNNEPLFLGSGRNVARLDLNLETWIQKLIDKGEGLTWFKHDFTYSKDAKDFSKLTPELQRLFLQNLKFQTALDSMATRTVLEVFKPITTNPQLEAWWTLHGFQEHIHSSSYAELIKALPLNANKIFDEIMVSDEIMNRVRNIIKRFDDTVIWNAKKLLQTDDYNEEAHKKSIVFSLHALHILEAGLFQTSFITTFGFAENKIMESSGKSMGKIAKDEINHKALTQYVIGRHKKLSDWKYLFEENKEEILEMYKEAYEADFKWIDYIFAEEARLLGLNANILKEYAQYNMYNALKAVGLEPFLSKIQNNPCSWANKYTNTSNMQVALNESDGVNYLLGIVDKDMNEEDYQNLKLDVL